LNTCKPGKKYQEIDTGLELTKFSAIPSMVPEEKYVQTSNTVQAGVSNIHSIQLYTFTCRKEGGTNKRLN
jgi:hypothetical protein